MAALGSSALVEAGKAESPEKQGSPAPALDFLLATAPSPGQGPDGYGRPLSHAVSECRRQYGIGAVRERGGLSVIMLVSAQLLDHLELPGPWLVVPQAQGGKAELPPVDFLLRSAPEAGL